MTQHTPQAAQNTPPQCGGFLTTAVELGPCLSLIEAITAVSGYVDEDRVVKIIEKIKFSPPHRGPS